MADTCPNCQASLRTSPLSIGRLLVCPGCGKPVPTAAKANASAILRGQVPPRTAALLPAPPLPASPRHSPGATWYVCAADGTEIGPFTKAELDQLAIQGRLNPEGRIRRQGWA